MLHNVKLSAISVKKELCPTVNEIYFTTKILNDLLFIYSYIVKPSVGEPYLAFMTIFLAILTAYLNIIYKFVDKFKPKLKIYNT